MGRSENYLDKVSWETLATITVVEGEGGAEARRGNAKKGSLRHDDSPRLLAALDSFAEERVQQKIHQLGVLLKGQLDVAEEHTKTKFGVKQTSTNVPTSTTLHLRLVVAFYRGDPKSYRI